MGCSVDRGSLDFSKVLVQQPVPTRDDHLKVVLGESLQLAVERRAQLVLSLLRLERAQTMTECLELEHSV